MFYLISYSKTILDKNNIPIMTETDRIEINANNPDEAIKIFKNKFNSTKYTKYTILCANIDHLSNK